MDIKNGGRYSVMLPKNEEARIDAEKLFSDDQSSKKTNNETEQKKEYEKIKGELPYQTWQRITGTSWVNAKKLGYTTGRDQENLQLQKDLLAGKISVTADDLKSASDNNYNNAKQGQGSYYLNKPKEMQQQTKTVASQNTGNKRENKSIQTHNEKQTVKPQRTYNNSKKDYIPFISDFKKMANDFRKLFSGGKNSNNTGQNKVRSNITEKKARTPLDTKKTVTAVSKPSPQQVQSWIDKAMYGRSDGYYIEAQQASKAGTITQKKDYESYQQKVYNNALNMKEKGVRPPEVFFPGNNNYANAAMNQYLTTGNTDMIRTGANAIAEAALSGLLFGLPAMGSGKNIKSAGKTFNGGEAVNKANTKLVVSNAKASTKNTVKITKDKVLYPNNKKMSYLSEVGQAATKPVAVKNVEVVAKDAPKITESIVETGANTHNGLEIVNGSRNSPGIKLELPIHGSKEERDIATMKGLLDARKSGRGNYTSVYSFSDYVKDASSAEEVVDRYIVACKKLGIKPYLHDDPRALITISRERNIPMI